LNTKKFQDIIDYRFKNKILLDTALTHSSYCREHELAPVKSNERLEFLGDAFLDAIAGAELYRRLPSVDEGKLTKTRALVVCEKSLVKVGMHLGIGDYLNMGNGEARCGGRHRSSIVADAVEAVIGAIFLDGGFAEAERFVLREFRKLIEEAIAGKLRLDYKTELQELLQQGGGTPDIDYRLDHEEGPDHDKTFYVTLWIDGERSGSGIGKSKKEAEQNAAKSALERRTGD
jgi:ribonuclease-3